MPGRGWRGAAAIGAYVVGGFALVLALGLAAFPFGQFRSLIEQRLSARLGSPVTIAAIERREVFSFHPTITIRELRVPQPPWAGNGDMARIERADVTFPVLSAFLGGFRPTALTISGARLNLVRTRDKRKNWEREPRRRGDAGGRASLTRLVVRDMRISYRDAAQDRAVVLDVAADPVHGLRASGPGIVRGSAVRVSLAGAPLAGNDGRWPFRATIDGADLAMTAAGTMAHPLDTGEMTLDLETRARDLKMVDAIIEAGLFETHPVHLAAHVERRAAKWIVSDLTGTIGQSRIVGRVTVDKSGPRTGLDGEIHSDLLDFNDFSSPGSEAAARAEVRAHGPKLVPETRINIYKISHTDGRIAFRATRIVDGDKPSPLTNLSGAVTLDRRLLVVDPLRIGLRQGALAGRAVVDQRDGAKVPKVTLDLRITGSSIGALAGGGGSVTGRVDARAYLVGRGSTIREAVGASDGRIGLAARDGSLPHKIAAALGFDAGRALLANESQRAGLRCVVVGADVRGGVGKVDPFIVDTSESRLDGAGTISFPSERLAIRLTGAPKRGSVLRLPGSAELAGTIREPDVVVPKQVKSAGNIFKAIGRAITGDQGPRATDADCAGLAAKVLR
ncbi:asmA family protein [Sphingomonas sp. CL5.1]|uniref:AsmA family protein n=1 Tax=Sphingomonas sp. CL5.1 TaxID=2653203 RepID=UPI0015820F5E|nr:AsmA-like C-terminal region-containing protein [Sphingomonas sp. CL5.1]QKR99820.1 asmA family protein [Sphingomonas sp. CL5.1]